MGASYWFERDVAADWARAPGASPAWVNTDGLLLRPSSHANYELWVDEIRLSNALTVEHNSLGVGAVGHIACARGCAPGAGGNGATGLVDTFYFYDHIGNVQGASEASGALASTCAQDAWGNVLSSLTTGAWAGANSGVNFVTKKYDIDIDIIYFWQRWYNSECGQFISSAPYPSEIEEPYLYCSGAPTDRIDPEGMLNLSDSCKCDSVLQDIKNSDFIDPLSKINNASVRMCIAKRVSKTKIQCNAGNCDNDPKMLASGTVGGFFGGGNAGGVTNVKGNHVNFCSRNQGAKCGKQDKINILIHEFAHNCGMPDEKNWPSSGAPGFWKNAGIPGTGPGGEYQCSSK